MRQALRHILLALLLLFSQQGAHLHALSHANRDLAAALGDEKKAPPVGHPAEQCLAFHALDSVLPGIAHSPPASGHWFATLAGFQLPLPFAPRIVFDSRAPPSFS
ncbi:MAG: hypothetical protein ACKVQK_10125 [Burkholderiales bacterium]